jgi:hypothetical protein
MPWFPSANGADSGDDANVDNLTTVVTQTDFLLSALCDEVERSRGLRETHVLRIVRSRRLARFGPMPVLTGLALQGHLIEELESWATRSREAAGEVEALERLPSDEADARGMAGAHAWLEVCERKHASIRHDLDEQLAQAGEGHA